MGDDITAHILETGRKDFYFLHDMTSYNISRAFTRGEKNLERTQVDHHIQVAFRKGQLGDGGGVWR
jgi:hypothetical protein